MMLKGIANGVPKDITRIAMRGKQLFDKDNANILNAYINPTSMMVKVSANARSFWIACDANAIYSISRLAGKRFMAAWSEAEPALDVSVYGIVTDNEVTSLSIATGSTAKYLVIFYYNSNYDTLTEQQIRDSIMLNLGSQALPYEPYGMQQGWEVRDQNGTILWGADKTLTANAGTLPIKGYGVPLKSVEVDGNMTQTVTPDPTTPIWPDETGERTANLFPLDATKLHVGRIENDGTIGYKVGTITVGTNSVTYQADATWRGFYTDFIQANENENLTFSPFDSSATALSCSCYDENDSFLGKATAQSTASTRTFTMLAGTKKVRIGVTSSLTEYTITNPMLNTGSTALPYEPFGYKIPITCAGQTVPVYLGQTQTVRRIKKLVLTGGEAPSRTTAITDTDAWQFPNETKDYYRTTFLVSHMSVSTSSIDAHSHGFIGQRLTLCFDKQLGLDTNRAIKSFLSTQYSAGTPVTVWYVLSTPTAGIVNEPLCKIGDYADTLTVTDQDVTITPAVGNDTITVDTTLPPSKLTITGHVKARSV